MFLLPFMVAAYSCEKAKTQVPEPVKPATLKAVKSDGTAWKLVDQIWLGSGKQKPGTGNLCLYVAEKGLSEDMKTATFECDTLPAGPYVAVFPYFAVDKKSEYAKISISVPGAQDVNSESFPSNIYTATWKEGAEMSFNPLLAKISITLSGETTTEEKIKYILIQDKADDAVLWGKGTYSSSFKLDTGTGDNKIELRLAKPLDLKDLKVNFLSPAGAFKDGIIVSALSEERKIVELVVGGSISVSLDKVSNVTINLDDSPFSGGKGTKAEPYVIATPENIVKLSELCNESKTNPKYKSASYVQICDIDMKGVDFTNICYDYDKDDEAFDGIYDGQNHKIMNMEAVPVNGGPCGLFGYIRGGTVKNLVMENATVVGTHNIGVLVGAAWKDSEVSNCIVRDSKVGSLSEYSIGGVVGYSNGSKVKDCQSIRNVVFSSDHNNVGGIVGQQKGGSATIENCLTTDCSISSSRFAGGILGRTTGGKVLSCRTMGKTQVSTSDRGAGGIVGGDDGTASDFVIDGCVVEEGVKVRSKFYGGGVAGYIYPGKSFIVKILNCGVEGAYIITEEGDGGGVSGDCCTGGIIGWLRNSNASTGFKVLNCYCYLAEKGFEVISKVTAPSIGAIVGYVSNSASSNLEIAGCCTDFARKELWVGGEVFKSGEEINDSDRVGAIYGYISHDRPTMSFRNCYWVNDSGFPLMGHTPPGKVNFSDNEGFGAAVFRDGRTVIEKLNAFASEYKDDKLRKWTLRNQRPVIEF